VTTQGGLPVCTASIHDLSVAILPGVARDSVAAIGTRSIIGLYVAQTHANVGLLIQYCFVKIDTENNEKSGEL